MLRDILADRVEDVLLLRQVRGGPRTPPEDRSDSLRPTDALQEAEGFSADVTLSARRKRHARAQRALEHDLQSALQVREAVLDPSAAKGDC